MHQNGQPGTLTRVPAPQAPAGSNRYDWVMRNARSGRGEGSGFSDSEMAALGSSAGGSAMSRRMDEVGGDRALTTLLNRRGGLNDGQAATMRVGGSAGDPDADHFITVGRMPDGTQYLYNPDPAPGDVVLATGADAVREANRYQREGRIRQDLDGDQTVERPNVVITRPRGPD
jgi:hypothetical protein